MSKTVAEQVAQIHALLMGVTTYGNGSKLVVQCLLMLEAMAQEAKIIEDDPPQKEEEELSE